MNHRSIWGSSGATRKWRTQHQHLKLQAGVQKTFHKDVISVKAVIEEKGILTTITSLLNLCRFQKHLAYLCSSKRPGQQKKCPTLEISLKCIVNQNRVYVNHGILLGIALSMTSREILQINTQQKTEGKPGLVNTGYRWHTLNIFGNRGAKKVTAGLRAC